MKKLLSITCAFALAISFANAQGFSLGVRAGLNSAKQTYSGSGVSISADSRTSFILGAYATLMFSDKLGLQPELFYSGTGASGSAENKINYLTLPVFLRYNITNNFHILAGPQLGVVVSAKDGAGNDIKDSVNSSDFGIVPGIGVDFGPFNAGLRYSLGLSNIDKSASGYTVKNNVFQVVVGYKLFGKGD
jgi:hypothetical protein